MAGISQKEEIKQYLYKLSLKKDKTVPQLVLFWLLAFLSFVYGALLAIRLAVCDAGLARPYQSGLKVISVGNITVGGTGKTPLVGLITDTLIKNSIKTAIISRGYKSMRTETGVIADEPMMLKKHFPQAEVIISADRIEALRTFEKNQDLKAAVLDDAFQNLKIKKDLDIVCIDCRNPFGNGLVLPAGIMRLPFVYLKNADLFVLTHCDKAPQAVDMITEKIRRYNPGARFIRSAHKAESLYELNTDKQYPPAHIKGRSIAAVSAIADPAGFHQMLGSLGARIEVQYSFNDHHVFSPQQMRDIFNNAQERGIETVVITAKDEPRVNAVLNDEKLKKIADKFKILILRIKIDLGEDEKRFTDIISAVYSA